MAQIELSNTIVFTGPDGTRAVLNDSSDPDYVGVCSDLTGLEDAEVREVAANRVGTDGGIHRPFLRGRRPLTCSGIHIPTFPELARSEAMTKLQAATDALDRDGIMSWTASDEIERYVSFRKQQPTRNPNENAVKQFNLALVAEDPRVYATQTRVATSPANGIGAGAYFTTQSDGNIPSPPTIILKGGISACWITQFPRNLLRGWALDYQAESAPYTARWLASSFDANNCASVALPTPTLFGPAKQIQMTAVAGGSMYLRYVRTSTIVTNQLEPAIVDNWYIFSFYAKPSTTRRQCRASLAWYNSAGALVSTTDGTLTLEASSGWTRYYVMSQAPHPGDNIIYACPIMQVASASAGESHFVTAPMLEPVSGASTPSNWAPGGKPRVIALSGTLPVGTNWNINVKQAEITDVFGGSQDDAVVSAGTDWDVAVQPGVTQWAYLPIAPGDTAPVCSVIWQDAYR